MSEERNLTTCKACGQIKPRAIKGKFDDKNKKYVDDAGRLWNGRVCPECHAERTKVKMKNLRLSRKAGAVDEVS